MLDFIQANWGSIAVVIGILIALLALIKLGKTDTVKKIVLSLVVQAEKTLGSGTGELKYAYVIDKLYDKIPKIVSFLYTKKEIDNMIEESVIKLKEILSKGISLSGYDDEVYIKTLSDNTGKEN